MTDDSWAPSSCPWWERVSAMLDGELDGTEHALVQGHLAACGVCERMHQLASSTRSGAEPHQMELEPLSKPEQRWLTGRGGRVLLALAAVALIVLAFPLFVRGNGNELHDHADRHLAMWQIGIGCGLLVAALASRFSQAMLAVAASFGLLTVIAAVYDVLAGHPGPWKDPIHLVELVGIILLWRLTPPHLLPWREKRSATSAGRRFAKHGVARDLRDRGGTGGAPWRRVW